MRRMTIIVAVIAALYSAYWVVGARAVTQSLDAQIAALRDAGWTVGYDDLRVQGFPSRFDTTATDLDVTAPDGSVAYAAPRLQALALSYQPNKLIVAFPPAQEVTLSGTPVAVDTEGLRASVELGANTALSLQTITAEATNVALTMPSGQALAFRDMLAALREGGPLPNSYDLYLNAQELRLPDGIVALIDAAGLPETASLVTANAQIVLDRPLNRHTLPTWQTDPGQLRGLTLHDLTMTWGDLRVDGAGEMRVNEAGVPDGTITLTISDWRRLLSVAQTAGLIPENYQFMIQSIGETLSAGANDMVLPITAMNGNLSVGPIPLGPAPRFF